GRGSHGCGTGGSGVVWALRGACATVGKRGTRLLGFSPGPRTAFKIKVSGVNNSLFHVKMISLF
ncbi:unnamed protein product, partial [Ectocarpus fasciculatus]